MRLYDIIWTEIAEKNLNEIVDYIALKSPINATNIYERIRKKAESLNSFPYKGMIVPELRRYGILKYREILVKPWRIIYKIVENKVYILFVIDSRRNVEDILLEIIINN